MRLDDDQLEQLAAAIAEHNTPARLLDAEQAGELVNVPATWLMREAKASRVPHIRLGKYVRFHRNELLAWIDARTTGPRARP